MPKKLLNMRIDEELRVAAQEAAKLESRSLTGMIQAMLIEKCKKAGTLPKNWAPEK